MKARSFAAMLFSVLVLAGCENVSQQWRERVDATPAKTREFPGEFRAVYVAARDAMKRIEFVVSRSSMDDGVVEGYSRIQPGDPTRSARQWQLRATLDENANGMIEIGLLMTELTEGGIGGAQERRAREHGLYDSYFDAVQQVLNENLAATRPGEN